MDDDLVRLVAMATVLCGLGAAVLGGLWTPVGGAWRDGERRLWLRQRTFWLRGEAQVPGGRQRYLGVALFGRVRLWRRDYGTVHLQGLGFQAQQAAKLEGQVTAVFWLRWRPQAPNELQGTFFGRRFAFDGGRLRDVQPVAGVARHWRRGAPDVP